MPTHITKNIAIHYLKNKLMECYNPAGYWESQLSSSALSTAVASFALYQVDPQKYENEIHTGIKWLTDNQNDDGGWGDTVASPSNLSTTLLAYSALQCDAQTPANQAAKSWIEQQTGSLDTNAIRSAVLTNYGEDKTFSAPILTMCSLAGILDIDGKAPWHLVPQLPFELAIFPHSLFKSLKLSVVSYAIPALIAIGLIRHKKQPSRNVLTRTIRNLFETKLLNVLQSKQPENGGFLEAAPLTGFVTMSLASAGFKEHHVLKQGVRFLLNSQRKDGSWPIDSNLNTWVTSLSTNALLAGKTAALDTNQKQAILHCLLNQQFKTIHPFTYAQPGGWGWTQLPGSVPDADDTSGALLAIYNLDKHDPKVKQAAKKGINWLMQLQNKDGGIPTFCKGWGKLPFDTSCPDITAHAFAALAHWKKELPEKTQSQIKISMAKMLNYLIQTQHNDGYWLPLWFGNQQTSNHENPVYGTSRVILYLTKSLSPEEITPEQTQAINKGVYWLKNAQNEDFGWGGNKGAPSTIEETAVAISALKSHSEPYDENITNGTLWLVENINSYADKQAEIPSAPIGLYFASLWYDEKLYPLVFALDALS